MKKTTLFSLALVAGMALSPSLANAESKVTLTTAKEAGADFSFVTNPGKITVDWGDGAAVELTTDGSPVTGKLKGQTVTVSAPALTFLDCSSNALTALDIADGTPLNTLFCSDNQLSALELSASRATLQHLDCSANKLSALSLTLMKDLVTLNCADNTLTMLGVGNSKKLTSLICSNNELSSLTITSLPELETLWCEGNALTTLNLNSNKKLASVACDNNQLTSVSVANTTKMVDFWCDNNQLEKLTLANNVNMKTLSCSNNKLTTLTVAAASMENPVLAFYCDGNKLPFASMHSLDNVVDESNIVVGPQGNFPLPKSSVLVGEKFTLEGFDRNADDRQTSVVYTWKHGDKELVKGTNNDYTVRRNDFTFNKAFDAVNCEVTSNLYPGMTLVSEPLAVLTEGTGIEDVMAAYGFSYVTNNGAVNMTSDKPYRVAIHSVDGKLVWNGVVSGTQSVTLGHGIFLINGKKVSL